STVTARRHRAAYGHPSQGESRKRRGPWGRRFPLTRRSPAQYVGSDVRGARGREECRRDPSLGVEAQGGDHAGIQSLANLQSIGCGRLTVGTISLLLIYFIPAPPSTVTMATGLPGSSFEHVGQRYRDIFARSHVELKLRETTGAPENVELLKNPGSGVRLPLFSEASLTGRARRACCRWEPCTPARSGPFIPRLGRWTDCRSSRASASPSAPWGAAFDLRRSDCLAGAGSMPRRPRCCLSEEARPSRHSTKGKWTSCGSLDCRMRRRSAHSCGIPRSDS